MKIENDYYLIVDVEATCSDKGEVPRDEMEIIEIGAVMQNSRTFEFESEFQTFIRPVRYPDLTDFCRRLTGIAQDDVADAPPFEQSLRAMTRWMQGFGDWFFGSWGDYDKSQFLQDCSYHEIDYPFGANHLNLKAEFSRSSGIKKKLGLTEALRHLGLDFEGSHHRGLDDAKNIGRIVRQTLIGA